MTLSRYLTFVLFAMFLSCANNKEKPASKNEPARESGYEFGVSLEVGGLYATKDSAGNYTISKILAKDAEAVHVRAYADTFKTLPEIINSADLKVLIGHFPMAKEGFLKADLHLIGVEDVREEELEGYKMYLEAMKQQ
jgi:hypothetical protein